MDEEQKRAPSFGLFWLLAIVFGLLAAWLISQSILALKETAQFAYEAPVHGAAVYTMDDIAESIVFVGDGGDAGGRAIGELSRELSNVPALTTVLFLGDNIYPRGFISETDPDYYAAKAKLDLQISTVRSAGVRGIFIPGNHDWDFSSEGGWEAVKRQGAYVRSSLGDGSFFPPNGCPGPVEAYASPLFRVLAFDSEWWMHDGSKPSGPESGCTAFTREGVAAEMRKQLSAGTPGVRQIVVSHHPFESDGHHARGNTCPYDMGCPDYAEMRQSIGAIFDDLHPFICAAGHDHSLQLMRRKTGCSYYVVSGALSNHTDVRPGKRALFSFSELGFIRVDALKDGRTALKVTHFHSSGPVKQDSVWLKSASERELPAR